MRFGSCPRPDVHAPRKVKLIDYFIQTEEAKIVMFVVPTRALVVQQAEYIKAHSHVSMCTVAELSGLEIAAWDAKRWQQCKTCCRVLVGTAEIFRASIVDNAYLKVDDISLCIFDECHNVSGRTGFVWACLM